MGLIFDSHAHYDSRQFDEDRTEILGHLQGTGIFGVLNVSCDLKRSHLAVQLAETYPNVWAGVGVHPSELEDLPKDFVTQLEKLAQKEKVVAIGEIGLDYHFEPVDKEAQRQTFEKQLELAKKLDLPVCVHDREAHRDTLELLRKWHPEGVVHCFSGSWPFAQEVLKLGLYIGLGGVVTFKNAREAALVARNIPLDRLLLETDAPYLAPEPYRGKRCESKMIHSVAEKIAEIRGMSTDELLEITCKNACRLFGVK